MDEEIDQMVTEDVQPSQVIVEGKGEVGKDSGRFPIINLDQLTEPLERGGREMDTRFHDDVGVVIKLERDMEGVGIGYQRNERHQTDSEDVLEGKRPWLDWSFRRNGLC